MRVPKLRKPRRRKAQSMGRPSPRSSRRASPRTRSKPEARNLNLKARDLRAFSFMRISRLEKTQVPSDVQELYTKVGEARGKVPNMFRVYAHRPEILKTMVAHLNAVTNSGTVPVRTKELVATLVSRLNSCAY